MIIVFGSNVELSDIQRVKVNRQPRNKKTSSLKNRFYLLSRDTATDKILQDKLLIQTHGILSESIVNIDDNRMKILSVSIKASIHKINALQCETDTYFLFTLNNNKYSYIG